MMKSEFIEKLRAIPGHETDDVTAEEYTRIEYVYMFHPSIPEVGGKDTIAYLYAFGGMMVIHDMYARAKKADEAEQRIRAIRKDIQGMEKAIQDLMEGVKACTP